ncbi:ribonucleoside triphosphate reductase [Candidatus Shapirobacteria bacterium CG08_land_8_20_14_0_20_39_18]|uniref:Ribonucleoside triphosphate reductase n=1 Tax=Candidatus Shapirobacteria bacterium CG08_land_8_20_14_0_20_39_18 TaxID=1974883 RepID=A0A2M6XDE0_9BACT|nr:MAG: ribonucleoside triphosphate reductase [Candidatus Shapirobacteria bacterium CG08_land_8_20_14_0_20_39_18]PIY64788.1 MAG: ribonucleoside triphosphate reductase [Candidatus Shapirobacteria bacterium CG_4_10_14_0_8_um_filter_39_15]PJE67915.1 MAG: ribonucleoside triphosphate reductase [Candidatus Shapirobacteria bacterium CG10_big_fil_rev_8_21_14_0_10_38_8]
MGRPKTVQNQNGNKNLTVNNLDTVKLVDDYVDMVDWRVSENANIGYSFGGLMLHVTGTVNARYALSKIYPEKISKAHIEGDLHLHDLFMGLNGYCAGWSLKQLLMDGFNGVPGKIYSKPPKHLAVVIGQLVNFLGTLQNEWAGAQAVSSFDTYLAPFVAYDKLTYEEVKQEIQQFVFYMNVPSRWGTQTPFTNITLDWIVSEDLAKQPVIIGGKLQKETYADFPKEMAMINKAFIEVMMEGDGAGQPFTFPIPTYNITKDFDWNSENAKLLFELTAKYGTPYFQNFVNSDLSPSDTRSMCCRLRLELKQLTKKTGGLFGFGESTGSVGVVTINLPRIGYLAKSKKEFFKKLGHSMDLAYQSLEIKRKVVQENMDRGLLPYSKRYLGSLKHHFSTIGLLGGNEACLNFLGKDISTPEGREFMIEVLNFMRKKLEGFQKKSGEIYNLEATPAEGTSYRFAKIDKKKFGDKIVTAGTADSPYYTNSTQLPVGATDDLFTALEHQDALQTLYTGGTVLHGFLGEKVSSGEACAALVKKIAYNFRLPYYTITPTFSICPDHGYLKDEIKTCPKCGKETLIYSRVVGYLRPVQSWNKGKKQEFADRLEYSETKSLSHKL